MFVSNTVGRVNYTNIGYQSFHSSYQQISVQTPSEMDSKRDGASDSDYGAGANALIRSDPIRCNGLVVACYMHIILIHSV